MNVFDFFDLFLMFCVLFIIGMGSFLNMFVFFIVLYCSFKGERGFVSVLFIIVGNGVFCGLDYRLFIFVIIWVWFYS